MESELQISNGYIMPNGGGHNMNLSTPPSQQNSGDDSGTTQLLQQNWNPRHLEIKTRTVEKTLEPLVMQVTTLVSSKSPQKKKGKSKVKLAKNYAILHIEISYTSFSRILLYQPF